jgi:hypothetical protein
LSGILDDSCIDLFWVLCEFKDTGVYLQGVSLDSHKTQNETGRVMVLVVIIFGSGNNSNPFQMWGQIKATSLCTWQEVKERILAPY